ncbi:MAG: hypothetical protein H0T73_06310, partial [Ardenticatenales bacterium]|nr:hypothetical protein [Ardenticatenales bacterium]
ATVISPEASPTLTPRGTRTPPPTVTAAPPPDSATPPFSPLILAGVCVTGFALILGLALLVARRMRR